MSNPQLPPVIINVSPMLADCYWPTDEKEQHLPTQSAALDAIRKELGDVEIANEHRFPVGDLVEYHDEDHAKVASYSILSSKGELQLLIICDI